MAFLHRELKTTVLIALSSGDSEKSMHLPFKAVCWALLRISRSWALPTTITSGSVLSVIFLGDLSAWQSLRGVGEKEPVHRSKEGT